MCAENVQAYAHITLFGPLLRILRARAARCTFVCLQSAHCFKCFFAFRLLRALQMEIAQPAKKLCLGISVYLSNKGHVLDGLFNAAISVTN